MLKLSALCLATLLALHAPLAAAQEAIQNPAQTAAQLADPVPALATRIDAAIAPYYKADAPGATVIVTRDGKTVLRKAYGMGDVDKGLPMTSDMALRLGSITKQFTAVGILMLADEGKLALGDDITTYLPAYPAHGKPITIEHLLTHTSGIVNYTSKAGFLYNAGKDRSVTEMINFFKNDKLEFEPGTRWAYSNSGYFLLGAIIEKVSGQPYAAFVEQRIFVPLGMDHSAYEGHERSAYARAAGHTKSFFGVGASKPLSMSQPYAAGALVSTVDDLARWDAAISAGKLLKPATWEKAHTAYKLADGKSTDYGYGWQIGTLRGTPMQAHGGGINGFSTYALRLPQHKVFVAVLSNTDNPRVQPEMVASKAAAVAIGNPFPEAKAVKIDGALLDAYAGTYQIDAASKRTFRRDKDQLIMQRTNREPVRLTAFSDQGFFMENALTTFVFARNAKGEVSQVTVAANGSEMVNQRIAP